MTTKVAPENKYDPKTATFWGRFVTDIGKNEDDAHTIALYESYDGVFFVLNQAPGKTGPVQGFLAEVINDPKAWLDEHFKFLKSGMV